MRKETVVKDIAKEEMPSSHGLIPYSKGIKEIEAAHPSKDRMSNAEGSWNARTKGPSGLINRFSAAQPRSVQTNLEQPNAAAALVRTHAAATAQTTTRQQPNAPSLTYNLTQPLPKPATTKLAGFTPTPTPRHPNQPKSTSRSVHQKPPQSRTPRNQNHTSHAPPTTSSQNYHANAARIPVSTKKLGPAVSVRARRRRTGETDAEGILMMDWAWAGLWAVDFVVGLGPDVAYWVGWVEH
ncbi:hypothetical protein Droror1_Dr00004373 [Drosera rotundifolia]